jgi:hypothetical protein
MAKIEIHPSLLVAHKVVSALEKILPKSIAKDLTIKSWSNCREQGLCLERRGSVGKIAIDKIVFSEARNSDEILVVYGFYSDFDMQTNQPTDERWGFRKYFKYNNYSETAEFIANLLKND